jgi:hypothetical protein
MQKYRNKTVHTLNFRMRISVHAFNFSKYLHVNIYQKDFRFLCYTYSSVTKKILIPSIKLTRKLKEQEHRVPTQVSSETFDDFNFFLLNLSFFFTKKIETRRIASMKYNKQKEQKQQSKTVNQKVKRVVT